MVKTFNKKSSFTSNENNINFLTLIRKAQIGDKNSIIEIIDKYKPILNKYSLSYKIKDYDKDDLLQIGKIAIIKAIPKYDISKGEDFFDAYIIRAIRNDYSYLARNQIKYNEELSLNVSIDNKFEVVDILKDSHTTECNILNKETINIINSTIKTFTPLEKSLLKATYFTPKPNLFKFCTENNISYYKGRKILKKLLTNIKESIDL